MAESHGESLPRYVAPLPDRLEAFALRYAWAIVAINVGGTAFGFYYYAGQFAGTPVLMWPWVPDSPLATLFMAASLALYKLGRPSELLNALAFIGNIKLGLWTPYTLFVLRDHYAYLDPAMYQFLFWSHLAMVVQAFLIHRYARFSIPAVAAALAWYTFDLTVDYFVPIVGGPHHTRLPAANPEAVDIALGATMFSAAAAGAVVFTILPTFLMLATRVEKERAARRALEDGSRSAGER